MANDEQIPLLHIPPMQAGWHCAMHGYVTACPFLWMDCSEVAAAMERTPDLQPPHGEGWSLDRDAIE